MSTALAGGVGIAVAIGVRHSAAGIALWLVPPIAAALVCLVVRDWLVRFFTAIGRAFRLRHGRVAGPGALALAGVVSGWIVWRLGPGVPDGGGLAAVLAAAVVLLFGGWVCLLTYRRVRAARPRWVRYLPDLLLAVVVGLDLGVLFSRDPLGGHSAAGLLLPVGVWAAVRTWRAMSGSDRLAARAAADIVLSLLLGAALVLFLVWLANLLNLPRAEVITLRAVLERVGSVADLPWWLWTVCYLLLAAASLAFALRPGWLAAVPARLKRVPVLPSVDIGRRVLTGVHIGLLVTVLVGVTAPAAVAATMHGKLRSRYTVALQRKLAAEGAQAAYEEIRRQFTPGTGTTPTVQPLADLVRRIHDTSPPAPGEGGATDVERDLAARIGRIQASTLNIDAEPEVRSSPQAAAATARFDPPVRDTEDLQERVEELDGQQHAEDAANRQAERAAELAATAVASTIPLLDLGEYEVVQIIKEYLQGLVEGSRLKDAFFAWTKRLTGAREPPPASEAVVPDPPRLRLAALVVLVEQRGTVRLAAPLVPDPVQQRAMTEPPTDAAVDLANEARYLDEGGTGPCNGCPRPLRPGQEPDFTPGGPAAPGEHERPYEPPRIHIR